MKNIIKVLLFVSISIAWASETPGRFTQDLTCKKIRKDLLQSCMNQFPGHGRPSGKIALTAFCHGVAYAQFMKCMQHNKNSVVTK